MLRAKYIRNAPDGNGTLFRGDVYQVPINGLLGGTTGHRIWEVKTTAQYTPGTRLMLEDGRVFRYAKMTNIVTKINQGVKFHGQLADGIATSLSQAQVTGDTTVTITAANGVAKDELKGGYLVIHTTSIQFRGILGNTVAAAGSDTIITLVSPLAAAVSTTYTEIWANPYNNVRMMTSAVGSDCYSSVAGLPFVVTTVANSYIWIQTWGPRWINPHGASLGGSDIVASERQLVFDWEGSVCIVADASYTTVSLQHAGFLLARNAAATEASSFIMLQISP